MLSIGELKRLEIARALATGPEVLCLDEVMGGLNPAEIQQAMVLVRALRDSGLTILMIEHHVHAVAGLSDRLVVLNFGKKIAEGRPGEALRDAAVVAAYLGDESKDGGAGVKALEVQGIDVFYRDVQAVWDVSFDVEPGEIVTLVGANGAGKTTTLRTVAGLLNRGAGPSVQGEDVTGMPAFKLVQRGLVLVPEARQLWPQMSVRENLDMGAYGREARKQRHETLRTVLEMFPILEKRASQNAGTLSGGEQQMCAIGRGLMARPKLLMLDEPSLGLAPMLVRQVFSALREINGRGVTVLLVEQNVHQALALATRGFVLETGHLTLSGQTKALLGDPRVKEKFLGEAAL